MSREYCWHCNNTGIAQSAQTGAPIPCVCATPEENDMLSEKDTLIADLPLMPEEFNQMYTTVRDQEPNAKVFYDPRKRIIELYPNTGGVIMLPVWQATGDLGPFAG